jgi:hypothetical protein
MKKIAPWFMCIPFLLGCVTKSPAPLDDVISLRLITAKEATNKFYAEGAPNPFTGAFLALTTMPHDFLTASLHVPKDVERVDVVYIQALSIDGSQIAEASTKGDMVEYWESMASESTARTRQMNAIERYYLPGDRLDGKRLGRDYVIVFMAKEKFKPTDRIEARFLVDGEEKLIEVDASSIIKMKR